MLAMPLVADEVAVPPAERVGRDEHRDPLVDRSQSLQHGEDESFFRSEAWAWHLAPQHVELLTEHQQLQILGT